MIGFVASLPGWILELLQTVASWAGHNPLTFVLLAILVVCALWLALFFMVQRKTRQGDATRAAHRGKPGSFPGDQR